MFALKWCDYLVHLLANIDLSSEDLTPTPSIHITLACLYERFNWIDIRKITDSHVCRNKQNRKKHTQKQSIEYISWGCGACFKLKQIARVYMIRNHFGRKLIETVLFNLALGSALKRVYEHVICVFVCVCVLSLFRVCVVVICNGRICRVLWWYDGCVQLTYRFIYMSVAKDNES